MTPPPAPRPHAELCILYLHHRDDAVTRHHLALIRRHNPRAVIVPLVDEPEGALPGAIDVARHPTPWNTADKWRSCDTMIYRWFQHRTCEAAYYLVLEYDCRVTVDLLDFYRPYLDADVVVARWRSQTSEPHWDWFCEIDRLEPDERAHAAGVTPIASTLFSHDALERVCAHVPSADVLSELRLGTAIQKAGLRVRELGPRDNAHLHWIELRSPILVPGFYHPVKAVHHNRRQAVHALKQIPRRLRSLVRILGQAIGPR